MKLCAVVVWYNPQSDAVENIKSYSSVCEKIYIVDNSSCDNSEKIKDEKNFVYLPLFDNKGIAAALNAGCSKALADGFEWCMTMDQDSLWDETELKKFISKSDELIANDSLVKSLAPFAKSPEVHSVLGTIRRKISKVPVEPVPADGYVHLVICSGNIINLKAFEEIGKFYEPFFIDEVDHEFCYRLVDHGYKIYQFTSVILGHHLGDGKITFFPSVQHSLTRSYYIIRNLLYVMDKYPVYAKEFNYPARLKWYEGTLLKYSFFKYFKVKKYVKKAHEDYRNNVMGKLSF